MNVENPMQDYCIGTQPLVCDRKVTTKTAVLVDVPGRQM
jgi:hypothetical protein